VARGTDEGAGMWLKEV